MIFNYHTHTPRCHHARGNEREYIEAAITAGVKILGFSDHAPQFYEDGFVSYFRMLPDEAEGYVRTLRDLAEEYRSDIELHIGFEAEYYPSIFPKLQAFCRDLGAEYLILGQHCLTVEPTDAWPSHPTEDVGILRRYVDEVLAGLATGSYSYVCHPDLMNFLGPDEIYDEEMTRLCRGAKALGIPLELNLLGLREHRHYPAERFIRIATRERNDIVLGCDAHEPEAFLHPSAEAAACELLSAYGITPLSSLPLRPI